MKSKRDIKDKKIIENNVLFLKLVTSHTCEILLSFDALVTVDSLPVPVPESSEIFVVIFNWFYSFWMCHFELDTYAIELPICITFHKFDSVFMIFCWTIILFALLKKAADLGCVPVVCIFLKIQFTNLFSLFFSVIFCCLVIKTIKVNLNSNKKGRRQTYKMKIRTEKERLSEM